MGDRSAPDLEISHCDVGSTTEAVRGSRRRLRGDRDGAGGGNCPLWATDFGQIWTIGDPTSSNLCGPRWTALVSSRGRGGSRCQRRQRRLRFWQWWLALLLGCGGDVG
ncbi:hypothetical protein TIFTF001_053117 [Ficus carica]|uniref:Uncharacterized protein n=1 Tax=Ficus carica TaxID=3494 RepID=A0AA88EG34_FICCA|nr:hypothetical protein TIFTF001_053117 [Ficus carica]